VSRPGADCGPEVPNVRRTNSAAICVSGTPLSRACAFISIIARSSIFPSSMRSASTASFARSFR